MADHPAPPPASAPPPSAPPPSPPSPPEATPQSRSEWPRITLWIVVVAIISVNALLVFRSCRNLPGEALDKTGQVIARTGQALADVASAFTQRKVTTEFLSYATAISNHHYFQFATLKQTEVFTRTEETTTGFGYIPLPDVVVEARAPVEFTYFVDLKGKWDFVLKDDVIYVLAPPIKFNKPAVDASAITYEVRKGEYKGLNFKAAEVQENLKKSITSLVTLRAKENIALVRENGRRQTTEFVEQWLMKFFSDGKKFPVKVYFAGEKPPEGVLSPNTSLP